MTDEYTVTNEETASKCPGSAEATQVEVDIEAPVSAAAQEEAAAPEDAQDTPPDPEEVAKATESIIERTPAARRALMETLDCCCEPCSSSVINGRVEIILKNNRSIYSPEKMRMLLETAGALTYLPSDQELSARASDGEPEVDEDGNLVMSLPEEGRWTLTEGGQLFLERHPLGEHLAALREKDADCLPVYRALLELLEEAPHDKASIDEVIDGHPLAQKPRRFASYFLSELEKGDAVVWTGQWEITDKGREMLAEMRDAGVGDEDTDTQEAGVGEDAGSCAETPEKGEA